MDGLNKSHDEKNMEEQILLNAEMLFLQHGFAGTSTVEIARRTGCNQALVHYYFRSKEKLFNAVFERKFKLFFMSLKPLYMNKELPIVERIIEMATIHFNMLRQHPDIARFVVNELVMNEERRNIILDRFGDFSKEWYPFLQAELDEAHRNGLIVKVRLVDVILDIVMLNVATFVTLPIAKQVFDQFFSGNDYLQTRLEENITLLNRRLKYQPDKVNQS
jgi:TetR/AcrR family transcriptional regulator